MGAQSGKEKKILPTHCLNLNKTVMTTFSEDFFNTSHGSMLVYYFNYLKAVSASTIRNETSEN